LADVLVGECFNILETWQFSTAHFQDGVMHEDPRRVTFSHVSAADMAMAPRSLVLTAAVLFAGSVEAGRSEPP